MKLFFFYKYLIIKEKNIYNYDTSEWSDSGKESWKEHFETTYYLKYNIEKSLYSLNKILQSKIDYSDFSNRSVYYHFYIDNVLNAIGHIKRRFYNNNIKNKNRIDRNRKEYSYEYASENGKIICRYPNINNIEIRHFAEHIDEYNEKLIDNKIFNGTFNVIYRGMNNKIRKELLNSEKQQNNLLNIITKEYTVLKIDKNNNIIKCTINLVKLKKELEEMQKINNKIWGYLNNKN